MNADTQFRTKHISSVPSITLYTRGSITNNNAHDNGQIFKKSSLHAKFLEMSSVYFVSYDYELLYFLQEIL